MIVSASSGTTSQAIFSITSRDALESASRSKASPPSADGPRAPGTTDSAGCLAEGGGGTARRSVYSRGGGGADFACGIGGLLAGGTFAVGGRAPAAGGGGRELAGPG